MGARVVLFDLDDTLLDSSGGAGRCWSECCAAHAGGAGTSAERLQAAVDEARRWFWSDAARHRAERTNMVRAWSKIAKLALEAVGGDPAFAEAMGSDFAQRRSAAEALFADALPTIDALRARGHRLGLVTNGDAGIQRSKLARHALGHYFDAIVIEGEFGRGKPDREVFAHALALLGAEPHGVHMVGDNVEWDVTGAQRAGLRGVWIDRTRSGQQHDPPADHTIHGLSELLELVG